MDSSRRLICSRLARKKCTVAVIDAWETHGRGQRAGYTHLLSLVADLSVAQKGTVEQVLGDRMVITFNVSKANSSHNVSAVKFMVDLLHAWSESEKSKHVRLHAAALSLTAYCGTWGSRSIMLGDGLDVCGAMLRLAAERRTDFPLVETALYEQLQNTYSCRQVDTVTVHPDTPKTHTFGLYQVEGQKATEGPEWIWHLEKGDKKVPSAQWNAVWQHLVVRTEQEGLPSGAYGEALQALEQYIEDHPDDPCGHMLRQAIQNKQSTEDADDDPVLFAGKVPFVAHYHAKCVPLLLQFVG